MNSAAGPGTRTAAAPPRACPRRCPLPPVSGMPCRYRMWVCALAKLATIAQFEELLSLKSSSATENFVGHKFYPVDSMTAGEVWEGTYTLHDEGCWPGV